MLGHTSRASRDLQVRRAGDYGMRSASRRDAYPLPLTPSASKLAAARFTDRAGRPSTFPMGECCDRLLAASILAQRRLRLRQAA